MLTESTVTPYYCASVTSLRKSEVSPGTVHALFIQISTPNDGSLDKIMVSGLLTPEFGLALPTPALFSTP